MTMTWSRIQSKTGRSAQESEAFDLLFQQNWEPICEVLFRLTGDWHEAEDLALETFLRLYEHSPADERNLSGWLYRVATNLGLNALRAQKRRKYYEDQAAREPENIQDDRGQRMDPARVVEKAQERQRVRMVLGGMKPRSAMLIVLRHSGLAYNEIAAALEIAPGSVGTLLVRAEREFAKRYKALEEE